MCCFHRLNPSCIAAVHAAEPFGGSGSKAPPTDRYRARLNRAPVNQLAFRETVIVPPHERPLVVITKFVPKQPLARTSGTSSLRCAMPHLRNCRRALMHRLERIRQLPLRIVQRLPRGGCGSWFHISEPRKIQGVAIGNLDFGCHRSRAALSLPCASRSGQMEVRVRHGAVPLPCRGASARSALASLLETDP